MTDETYFYDDPLAAAWMSKHHNLYQVEPLAMGINAGEYVITRSPHLGIGADTKFYIHPDSLHLLIPQVDDIVLNCDSDPARVVVDDSPPLHYTVPLSEACRWVGKEATISRRDGKPFHWPKREG